MKASSLIGPALPPSVLLLRWCAPLFNPHRKHRPLSSIIARGDPCILTIQNYCLLAKDKQFRKYKRNIRNSSSALCLASNLLTLSAPITKSRLSIKAIASLLKTMKGGLLSQVALKLMELMAIPLLKNRDLFFSPAPKLKEGNYLVT